MYRRIRIALREDSNLGLIIRVHSFGVAMVGVFWISWLGYPLFSCSISVRELLVVFLSVCIPVAASIVVGERPRGNDWIMVRLSLATFCRTGLPIFLAAVINFFSQSISSKEMLGFFAFFYLAGILVSVSISLFRLEQGAAINADNGEV